MSVLDKIREHAASRPAEVIDVPEWGLEAVQLRPLTLAQHGRVNREKTDSRKMARLLILSMHDASGTPVFGDNADSLAAIESGAADVVTRIAQKIMGTVPDEDEAKNA